MFYEQKKKLFILQRSVVVPDVYIIDYAVEPEPRSNFVKKMAILLFGVFVAFSLAIAPILLINLFDPTAKTEAELRQRLALPVLESIPFVRYRLKTTHPDPALGVVEAYDPLRLINSLKNGSS
jgi:capsular polysaccharide biosynthesis protein